MTQPSVRDTTTVFIISGDEIMTKITSRVKRHEGEISRCLDKVALVIRSGAEDMDSVAKNATGAMLAVHLTENLTTDTVAVKSQLERAAHLTRERLDLLCIARNLGKQTFYKVTLEEAQRYGLV